MTNGGNIAFQGTVDGAFGLTLSAGTAGNVMFTGLAGNTTPLGAVQINSANGVTTNGVRSVSYAQTTGQGTSTLNGGSFTVAPVVTEAMRTSGAAGISVTAKAIVLNSSVTTTGNGPVALGATANGGGALTIVAAGAITANGSVGLTGTGGIGTAGSVTTNVLGATVTYNSAVTLTGGIAVDTTSGGTYAAGSNIIFANTLGNVSAQTLGLTAGTTGNVVIAGSVGIGTALGAISIISANNVAGAADASAPTAAITAASLNQSAGYGKTVLGAVTTAGNISLTLTDLDFDGVVLDGGILNIYTQGGTGTIGLGSATGTLTLSNADLQHIRNATIINIGRSGNQSGLITATSAQFYSGISNLAAVNINSDFSTGTISLSDNTNTALDLNGNANIVLTLSSGTGGITATNNNGTNASISNTGAGSTTVLKTNSAGATSLGGIGANARIIFSNGSQPVQIVNNNGSGTVALGSLGPQALTIGGAGTSVTGNRTLNVTTASGDLTLASQISSGTGDISLSPAGNVNFAYSSLPIITQTTANLTIARPVILQADATITQVTGSGLDTIQFQSTIDSQNSTARALTVTGAGDNVIIAGATGASNQLSSLTVTSGAVISVYNVGNSATPSAGVATLSVTADTTGSIIFSGSYYQTGGNQSWIAGTSATPRSLTTLGATSWYTQATLAVEGNLTSATSQTFYSNDINLGGYGAWNWGSSNTLHFYTYTPSTQMNVGYDDGNSAHWNLSGSDITCLDAAATTGGTIAFGQSGTQYGLIYFKTADFSAANSGAGVAIVANSDTYSGPTYGAVSFDSGGSGVALKSGTKNITINAYQTINGVTRDGHGHLSTTGDISLNVNAAAGVYIGTGPLTFTLPIQIVTGTSGPTVNASGNTPQGVWLEGVGSGITLGTVNITGSIHTDLYSGGTIYLTQDIDSGGQSIIFSNPVQIYPSSGSSITLTTEGGNVIFSSTFDEYSGSSAGKDSLTIVAGTGGVTFADALGGTNAIGSLTISSAGVVTVSKGITTANAGSVSITHSGVLSLIDFTSLSDTSTPDLNLAGAFLENGTGSVQISADITTANAAITFNTPVQLTGSVLLNAGSGSIAFQINATIDKFSGATYSDLIVDSTGMAAGTITFGTAIGASSPIASLTTGLSAPSTVSGGFIKTSGAQNYNGPMTISANNLTLTSTNNGAITFGSSATVNGGNSLSIGNGTGAVTFGAAVGVGTPLTSLTISSTTGTTVLNGGTIATSGTQTYDDPVTLGAATTLTTTNSAVTFGSAATVNGGYALSIGNGTGVVTFGAAVGVGTPLASLTISSTTGTTVLNGGLIVTSGPQSYDDPVLLGAGTTFTTSNSNIAFAATVNPSVAPGQTLTLIAGSGAVTIGGTIGASSLRLGALQITSAADASFGGAIYGTSFTQVAGIGTTTFNALQNYAGNFSFAGTNLTVNAAWTVGGATTVTNSGVFTTAASNAAPLASSGPFTQANNGGTGTSSLGSSITTTNTNISFANPIVLASGIQLSTQASAGAGNITLSSTVDAVTAGAGAQGLTLAAGTGSITASGNIGAVVPLGALTVTSAANATFTGTVTAASFTQVAGTGKTTFNALQNYTGNFSFAGTNLTVNAAWTVGGTTTVTNAGVFATAIGNAALTSAGAFTQGGTGGSNSLGSNITTTNAAISFGDPIVLTSGIQLSTQASAGAGNITLSNTVDATSTNSPGQGLALTAGSGSVTFSNHVGATTRLASMNVIAAAITLDGSVLTTGAQEYSGSTSVVGSLSGSVVNAANALLWFNGPVTHTGGSINAGANTTSSPPDVAIRFSDDYIGSSPAVLNGNSAASGVEFDGNATLPGNNVGLPGFNRNGDSLLFKGAALQTFDSNAQLIGNVTIDDGIGVEIVGHSVYQTGGSFATTINSGYLDVVTKGSSVGWVADSAVGTAATVGLFDGIAGSLVFGTGTGTAARELRCVSLTTASGFAITNTDSNTITASGNMIIAGGFSNPLSPAAATATLVMTGTGVALTATPQIGNLTVTGSISLDSALLMYGSMKIASGGTLNVSPENCNITIEGDWSNSGTFVPANGTVLPGTGTVSFTKPTSRDSGIIYVSGNNNWYVFDCEVNGISVYFEKNNTQSILQNGSFRILSSSSSSVITLSRNDSDQASDLDWLVAVPPDPTKMWQINVNPGATVDMDNVMVKYSDAREHPIAKPAGVKLFVTSPATPPPGYTYLTCYEWISGILAVYSYAEDSDGDGKIDRIRVVAQSPLDGNFSGFTAVVSDYTIDTSKGTNGFEMVPAGQALPSSPTLYGGYGYEFWIHLVEKPYNDTGVTLSWAISNNTSLKDDSTGKYYLYTIASPLEFSSSIFMKTIDTAAPRVAYTLAIPGSSTVFFHFSEPVYGSTTDGAVSPSDFIGATGMTPVTTASDGIGVSEALVIYPPNAFSALDILNGQLLNLSTMYDYMPPSPPDDYATDSTWTPFWAALGGLPPHVYNSATSSASWPTPIASTTHRVSDVLVSVPIGSGTGQYFLWPIYAKDQVDVSLSDAQIANLTPAESAAQGIGLIRAFDGSQWLRAQDITVQASLLPALSPLSGCTLWFDTGVPAGLENSGLWLPAFAQTGFSGLVPYPNASPWGRGASPTSGVAASSGSNLWNFKIPKSDPRIVSGSTLDFFLTLQPQGSGQPLYGLRLDMTGTTIPNDWYRLLKPFSFQLHNVTLQRGSVTILNNVIDPTKGETVRLSYNITQAGMTTITVFTLDGDVVKRLYMGNQSVGNYSTYWDGTNLSGSVVARGIYFIRVVAPGVDEIRKVMVVRKL